MSLRSIFLILAIFAATASLYAQPEGKRQSLSLSFYPLTHAMIEDINFLDIKSYEVIPGKHGYKAVGYSKESYSGALSLEYKHYMSNRCRFDILLGCELSNKKWDIYDIPDGPRTKRIFDYRITVMPGVDYIYSSKKSILIYGSAYAGMEFLCKGLKYFNHDQRYQNNFAWQIMPFCIDVFVSDSLSLGGALGGGTLGFLRLSLSYNFFY